MSAADLGQIIALLIAATGLFLTALQIARQRREQRMGQIIRLHECLYNDHELQEMYRRLERGNRIRCTQTLGRQRLTLGSRSSSTSC